MKVFQFVEAYITTTEIETHMHKIIIFPIILAFY
jgi:hypothetical protein